jgi:hypothetical protein
MNVVKSVCITLGRPVGPLPAWQWRGRELQNGLGEGSGYLPRLTARGPNIKYAAGRVNRAYHTWKTVPPT